MARKGRILKITKSTSSDEEKNFLGDVIEGTKKTDDVEQTLAKNGRGMDHC